MSSDKPQINSAKDWLRLICCGLCMGTADIIPGISGGTIAFIMGFYEDLLNSIKSFNGLAIRKLFSGHFRVFFSMISWKFLVGLVAGIVIAMASLAHFVTYVLNHEQYRVLLYASFFGLIIAASILCGLQIARWKAGHLFAFLAAALMAFFLTGAIPSPASTEDSFDVKLENHAFDKSLRNYNPATQMLQKVPGSVVSAMLAKGAIKPSTQVYSYRDKILGPAENFIQSASAKMFDGWIILCGAIAICAMILPGISGSYLLTVLGMYAVVVGALADFVKGLAHGHFDAAPFMILVNMLIGILLGALLFTRCVSWVLKRYHDLAIAALTGFMVGALRSVWPFWNYQYALLPLNLEKGPQLEITDPLMPSLVNGETWMAITLAICGAGAVFALHVIAQMKTKHVTSEAQRAQR